jgi:hypothetical protein
MSVETQEGGTFRAAVPIDRSTTLAVRWNPQQGNPHALGGTVTSRSIEVKVRPRVQLTRTGSRRYSVEVWRRRRSVAAPSASSGRGAPLGAIREGKAQGAHGQAELGAVDGDLQSGCPTRDKSPRLVPGVSSELLLCGKSKQGAARRLVVRTDTAGSPARFAGRIGAVRGLGVAVVVVADGGNPFALPDESRSAAA